MMENYQQHSRKLAQRFLQTAVVVDDEAYMSSEEGSGPKGRLVIPDRRQRITNDNDQGSIGRSLNRLNASSVMDSFSALGIICGVVGPTDKALATMRKADIIVLDWLLRDASPEYTLELLKKLLTEETDKNSLRLVSIYTGENDLEGIREKITEMLEEVGLGPKPDENKILYQHGRVVLYAKSDVKVTHHWGNYQIVFAAEKLPVRLVEDFASMTSGLLPAIALTSLAAVREGAHKVLDRFCSDLDPAFLAHRMCLTNPDDAERHIVESVAEELRGLIDNDVATESSAGKKAVECWMRKRHEDKDFKDFKFVEFLPKGNPGNREKISIELVSKGFYPCGRNYQIEDKKIDSKINRYIGDLSKSLSVSNNNVLGIDERLAWIMSFRMPYNEPPPTLRLGSVVTQLSGEGERHLICMRPRCDCVRLEEETSFFFLPLIDPSKEKEQIVVRLSDNRFERLGIRFDSAGWVCQSFEPSQEHKAVIAKKQNGHFEFMEKMDSCSTRYRWLGELRDAYAQRIAQNFGASLSRVATNDSEWLRRIAK